MNAKTLKALRKALRENYVPTTYEAVVHSNLPPLMYYTETVEIDGKEDTVIKALPRYTVVLSKGCTRSLYQMIKRKRAI